MNNFKLDGLFIIAYIDYFNNPKGKARVHPKVFMDEKEAHEVAKSLNLEPYTLESVFINENNGK